MKENVLAIDCGTQSVRALIFSPKGEILGKKQVFIEPYFSKRPGWAEQEPAVFWDAVCEACQGVLSDFPKLKSSIAAISLTGQRATVVNMDANGNPLRPAIVWPDQRQATKYPKVGGFWGLAFTLAGERKTVAYLQGQCEANWLSQYQPEIWEKTFKYTYLSGYLTHKLSGNFVDSIGCQVGYMPFDYKKQTWAAKSHWYWQALDIQEEKLVDLVPVGAELGRVTAKAAKESGLTKGLPIIAAGADKACEVLGSGALEPNVAAISYGTAATINTTHGKYIEIVPLIPPYPAAVPGLYNMELQIYRGYWMVSWFKQEFGLLEQRIAEKSGLRPEVLFDDLVAAVPPGSQGLVLQPYWSPGLRHPGPEARGAIIGFSDAHTRAHLYRAILEGMAYALLDGKERTEKRAKVKIDQVRVAGGGSQSGAAMQITADVFGLPVSRPHIYEASGLGAAINAAVGAGIHPDYPGALQAMTHLGDTFEPQMRHHAIYRALYEKVYLRMYQRLQPFYESLQEINLPTMDEKPSIL